MKNGICKLGDLGISKVLNSREAKAKTYCGTPYYMAPEIVDQKNYGFPADIWALGVLLYEMCALKCPFEGKNTVELFRKIKMGIADPIPKYYSDELRVLISYLLKV